MAKTQKSLSIKEINADSELKAIGERIRELRKAKGYTSYETFANEHDIHRVQWGRYEQGQDMRSSTLIKIMKILGVSAKDFFADFK